MTDHDNLTDQDLLIRCRRSLNDCNTADTDQDYEVAWEDVEECFDEMERRDLGANDLPRATEV